VDAQVRALLAVHLRWYRRRCHHQPRVAARGSFGHADAAIRRAQRNDINALRDAATRHGWDSEATGHTRTAASITGHLQHFQ
jgi:hypothetical protein